MGYTEQPLSMGPTLSFTREVFIMCHYFMVSKGVGYKGSANFPFAKREPKIPLLCMCVCVGGGGGGVFQNVRPTMYCIPGRVCNIADDSFRLLKSLQIYKT